MDKKNLMPQASQPVNRTTIGQLSAEFEALQLQGDEAYSASVLPALGANPGAIIRIRW